MNKVLLTLLLMAISSAAAAQAAFSSLEEQMKGAEFEAAGLDKLTAAELAALNQWIRKHSLATLDQPRAARAQGGDGSSSKRKMKSMPRETINSRVIGTFTGWDGQATFRLENGMVWQQVDKDKFYVKAIKDPVVTIEPGRFKSWRLSVEGHKSACKVIRIQ